MICQDAKCHARCSTGVAKKFSIKVGMRQGLALFALLFTAIVAMTHDIQKSPLCDLLYANDTFFAAPDLKDDIHRPTAAIRSEVEC